MTHYRIAMGVGTALVLGLGIAGLFPLALAGAAVLVPLLAALYLHDVNIYEAEPILVIGFTLAWGAVAWRGRPRIRQSPPRRSSHGGRIDSPETQCISASRSCARVLV